MCTAWHAARSGLSWSCAVGLQLQQSSVGLVSRAECDWCRSFNGDGGCRLDRVPWPVPVKRCLPYVDERVLKNIGGHVLVCISAGAFRCIIVVEIQTSERWKHLVIESNR